MTGNWIYYGKLDQPSDLAAKPAKHVMQTADLQTKKF
jgi:hypothetical protein